MHPYLSILRPNVCLLTVLGLVVGALVAGTASLTIIFAAALIAAFLISGAGDVINDYFDRNADKINKPHRPIPSGKISPSAAKKYFSVLTVAGLALASFVSNAFLAIALVNWLVASAYPWKAKKIPVVKNLFVAYLAASSFLAAGFIATAGAIVLPITLLALIGISFVVTFGREIIKDVEDMAGDTKAGVKTLPSIIGEKPARVVAYVFIIIGCGLLYLPFDLGIFGAAYLVGAIPAVVLCLTSMVKPAAISQKMLKAAMYLAIIGFILGVVI